MMTRDYARAMLSPERRGLAEVLESELSLHRCGTQVDTAARLEVRSITLSMADVFARTVPGYTERDRTAFYIAAGLTEHWPHEVRPEVIGR